MAESLERRPVLLVFSFCSYITECLQPSRHAEHLHPIDFNCCFHDSLRYGRFPRILGVVPSPSGVTHLVVAEEPEQTLFCAPPPSTSTSAYNPLTPLLHHPLTACCCVAVEILDFNPKRFVVFFFFLTPQIRSNIIACFSPEYKRTTFMLMAVWFTMSFR